MLHEDFKELLILLENNDGIITNPRGRGLFRAFDIQKDKRAKFLDNCYNNGLIILGSGEHSVRFRPALNLTIDQVNEGAEIIAKSIKEI
jgi:L-lysine 6-transaminase